MADGFGLGVLGRVGNKVAGSDELFDLLRPLHVIRPRLLARQALDEVLQASPEAYLLQRVVEPACSDAEVGLMGRDVVDAMVFTWQDDMPVLQEGDPVWQPEVRV